MAGAVSFVMNRRAVPYGARPTTTQALSPPKPNEFDIAISIVVCGGPRWGTKSRPNAGLRLVEVDGRVQETVLHLHEQGHQLDQTRRGQAVPEHGLGRVDRDAVGMIAEDLLDRLDLGGICEDRSKSA